MPDSGIGVATASATSAARGMGGAGWSGRCRQRWPASATPRCSVERAGNQRWLVVKQAPEQLWPQLKAVLGRVNGFVLATECHHRQWKPNGTKTARRSRRTLSAAPSAKCSTPCIRPASATSSAPAWNARLTARTEIYISHRGAEEVLTGPQKETAHLDRASERSEPGSDLPGQADGQAGRAPSRPNRAWPSTTPHRAAAARQAGRRGRRPHVQSTKASTAPGAGSAWRWTAPASPWKTATACRASTSCATSPDTAEVKRAGSEAVQLELDDKDKEAQRYRIHVKSADDGKSSQVTVQTTTASRTPPRPARRSSACCRNSSSKRLCPSKKPANGRFFYCWQMGTDPD
jgi:outer membrane protein assembly factor BamC